MVNLALSAPALFSIRVFPLNRLVYQPGLQTFGPTFRDLDLALPTEN